jgi:hypothetical protein
MADNKIQVKRTSTSGRSPNTTNSGNSQYIVAGELALNMTDGILFSSNGSTIIEIGANNTNVNVTGNLAVKAIIANGSIGSSGKVLTSNGSGVYWETGGGGGSVDTDAQYIWTNTQTFSNTVFLNAISANGSLGANGQVLTSDGSDSYWYSPGVSIFEQFVGDGANTTFEITGGYAPSKLSIYINGVLSRVGSEVNTTSGNTIVFTVAPPNGSLIDAIGYKDGLYTSSNTDVSNFANNASYLGGVISSAYVQNTDSRTLSGNLTFSGITTFSANIILGSSGVSSNGSFGIDGHVLHSNGTATYWAVDDQGVTSVASGNGLTGGPITNTGTVSVLANTGIVANVTGVFVNADYIGTISANNSSFLGGVAASSYQTTAGLSANVATLTSNNSTNFGGQLPSFYTNATNITTGTLPYAQIPANIINTTAAFTRTGITTFSANVVLGSSGVSSNGSFGTAGQVLHSNGTATYWDVDDQGVTSVATGNGMTGGTITATGTVSILANTGIVANATGVFVNSAYIATIAANSATFANSSVTNTFTVGTSSYFVANGNVGVGNTGPTHKLSVNGTTFLQANVTLNAAVLANNSTGTNGQVLTSTGSGVYWANGSSGSGSSVTVSNTTPSSPSSGDLWFNTEEGITYVYYDDGTSAQWVDATSYMNTPNTNISLSSGGGAIQTDWSITINGGGAAMSNYPFNNNVDGGFGSDVTLASAEVIGGDASTSYVLLGENIDGGVAINIT